MSKKTLFALFVVQILIGTTSLAGSGDTILNMVISKPFFYNIMKGSEEKVIAGTSDGMFELNGIDLIPLNDRKGYITSDANGKPDIDISGIRYYNERKFLHLLPFPEIGREEYHVTTPSHLYICSGGRLYIFDLVPYEYSYPYHSIRTISKDYVGSYSGIYFKENKMDPPTNEFTDGYIRQFGDRAFICNYGLQVLERDFLKTGILRPNQNSFFYFPQGRKPFVNDIHPDPLNRQYYLATGDQLIIVDSLFTKDSVLFTIPKGEKGPINLIPGHKWYIHFSSGKQLYYLDHNTRRAQQLVTLTEPIIAGVCQDQQVFILTQNSLFRFSSGMQLEKLTDIERAHSLLMLSGSNFIISSDFGLYHFDLTSRSLSSVIKGVEFNRRALHSEGDFIYAGSINGLYKIKVSDIPELIDKNQSNFQLNASFVNLAVIIGFSLFMLGIMGTLLIRYRTKLKKAERTIEVLNDPTTEVTRHTLEEYIKQNLSKASLRMLQDEFKISASQLYIILKPDRPGSIIQNIRLAKFKQMKDEGRSLPEISESTGLSVSYLRKLKA
jgi:hypothetical protein